MFKVGGMKLPQFQFLTTFVCGQETNTDTDICHVPYNNTHQQSFLQ